jgi:uncharacterized protein YqgQ
MPNDDEDNFLDNDEITGVSDNLYEWTYEQAILVTAPIDKDERAFLNWYSPNGQRMPALVKKLAIDYDVTFRLAAQTLHAHGMSILLHNHEDMISLLTNLQSQLSENYESEIFNETGKYKNCFLTSHTKLIVISDLATADVIGDLSIILHTPKIYVSTAAMMYSLVTSSDISAPTKEYYEKKIKSFETGLKTVQSIALGNV